MKPQPFKNSIGIRQGQHWRLAFHIGLTLALLISLNTSTPLAYASTPSAGGDTTVVNPSGEGAVSINEDSPQPESANIRLIVPTLSATSGTPNSIRITSVTGGSLQQGGGGSITLGTAGTVLTLSSSRLDLRFAPSSNRDIAATFQYVVVDPQNSSNNSAESTATIPITAVNDLPILQTSSGGTTGEGLAGTYYRQNWDLTGVTTTRVDATVDFNTAVTGSNTTVWGVSNVNAEQFSVRWSGKIKAPITGSFTISTNSDDGVRVWLDDVLVINNWTLHGPTVDTASPVSWEAGSLHSVRMEFYERGGGELAQLRWAYTGQSTQVIPQQYLYPGTVRPTLTYLVSSGAVAIDDGLTITDVDSSNMSGATISVATYVSGQDSLGFTNQNGITGSFNSSTGVLTLSGSASIANYQTALRTVTYTNSSGSPTTTTRTVTFLVNDGSGDSNSTTRNIDFSATNNAPVITQGTSTSVTMDEDGSPTAFSLTLSATDQENNSLAWSIDTAASHGTASASGTGVSKDIGYTPTANYAGSDSFVVKVIDGFGGSDTITVNVTITARNDAPTFTEGTSQSTTIDEDSSPTAFSLTLHASDVENDTLTWSVSTAASHGAAAIGGSGNTRSIVYEPNEDYNGNDTFAIRVSDGNGGTATYTVSLTITARNDAPVATVNPVISSITTPVRVDYTLTANRGSWNDTKDGGTTALSYTYQWQRCTDYVCTSPTDITGATSTSYTLTSEDKNAFVRAKVAATDDGTPGTATSYAYSTSIGQILATPSNLTLNQGKAYINDQTVPIDVTATNILTGATQMIVSEDPNFIGASWQTFADTAQFMLSNGDGKKTVYVKFRDAHGNVSGSYSNTITLDTGSTLNLATIANQFYILAMSSVTTDKQRPSITGIAEPYATVTITIHSDPIAGSTTADENGYWSWTPDKDVAFGNHELSVMSTDLAGNNKKIILALTVTHAGTTAADSSAVTTATSEATSKATQRLASSTTSTTNGLAVVITADSTPPALPVSSSPTSSQNNLKNASKTLSNRYKALPPSIGILFFCFYGWWLLLLAKRRKKKKVKRIRQTEA